MSIPHLSIIIPAYNEAHRLLPSLEQVAQFIQTQHFSTEVIIVDDGSTDATYQTALQFIAGKESFKLLKNPRNMGKGASIKKGMQVAAGEYRLFSDADLSTPLDETHKFISFLEPKEGKPAAYQIVIGSRRMKGAVIGIRQPLHREGAGRIFSILVRLFLLKGFLDTQCGFKMFTADAAQKIFPLLSISGFGFDIELLFLARRLFNLNVKEAPVTWYDSAASQVRLLKDSLKMFLDIFRIRWNGLRGVYKYPPSL